MRLVLVCEQRLAWTDSQMQGTGHADLTASGALRGQRGRVGELLRAQGSEPGYGFETQPRVSVFSSVKLNPPRRKECGDPSVRYTEGLRINGAYVYLSESCLSVRPGPVIQ